MEFIHFTIDVFGNAFLGEKTPAFEQQLIFLENPEGKNPAPVFKTSSPCRS